MPVKTVKNKEFVSIPREIYEEFLIWQRAKNIKSVKPTKSEVRAIRKSESNFAKGKYVSWEKVKYEMGFNN